jgi:Domain of unknown function (DUF4158)
VARLSDRLGIPVGEMRGYGGREQTRTGHLRDIAAFLGWRTVDGPRWKDLEEFLLVRAMEHDSLKLLFRQACEYLSSSRVVRPGGGVHPGARRGGPGTRSVSAAPPR